jgi:hypothetical protein
MATAFTNFIKLQASSLARGARRQASRPLQYFGARLEHEYNEAALKAETLLWQTMVRTRLYATWLTLYSFSVTKNATVSNRSSASVTPGKSTGSANSTRNATVTGLLQRRRPSLINAPRPREQLAVAKLSSARSVLRTDPGRASSPALRQSG